MFPKNNFHVAITLLLFLCLQGGYAQLSDLHYLPPLKQESNNQAVKEQSIYLSTPSTTSFTVNVYQGNSLVILTSFSLSKATPVVYNLPDGDNNILLLSDANTGVIRSDHGLRFEAPSGDGFYVNYRGRSGSQGMSLTSKGRAALGRNFKWGGAPILANHYTMGASIGIMATTDNTTVDIFGYDPDCEFRLQADRGGITANSIQVVLQRGQTYVLEAVKDQTASNVDGWLGASVQADQDIAISVSMLNFGVRASSGSRDAGADQPVPENLLGREYVFIRGYGANENEFPLIIGTQPNTAIYVNGSAAPIATIGIGEYFQIPGNNYSNGSAGGNMFVETSQDSYAYQVTSGDSGIHTVGLNFIAPVNCLMPDTMDHIPDIEDLAGIATSGGLTIISSVTTPDSDIVVTDSSGTVTLPPSAPVAGSVDWKTFFVPGLTGDVTVQSTGPVAVGFLGFSGARGIAGYFSGFDTVPNVSLEITGSGCYPGGQLRIIEDDFQAYQWYKDGIAISGATSNTYDPTGPGDYYVEVTKGPCTYDSNILHTNICSIITNRRITVRVNRD